MVLLRHQFIRYACWIPLVLGFLSVASAEVVVVTSAKRAPVALSKGQVSDLFLGKVASFPDGKLAAPIDQPESNPLREEFYEKVTNKSAAQVKANWAKLYFTGRGVPPRASSGSEDVKKLLNTTPGGIGYIERSAIDSSVQPIQIVEPTMKVNQVKGNDFGE